MDKLIRSACTLQVADYERKVLSKINTAREDLLRRSTKILLKDYGAGHTLRLLSTGRKKKEKVSRSIASIVSTSTVSRHWGIFLFKLVREFQPNNILELGTNAGISASYIQAALDLNANGGHVVTIEGDPMLASIAKETISKVSDNAVEIINGKFQDVLPPLLNRSDPYDFVFIDGHHEEQAMFDYFTEIYPRLSSRAFVIFDDIYPWNISLRRGWARVKSINSLSVSYDFAKFGIIFPHSISINADMVNFN